MNKLSRLIQLPFWRNKWTQFSLWMLMVAISVGLHMHNFNNFLIYKYTFWHALQGRSLFENYGDHGDVNHYGPIFSLIIALLLNSKIRCRSLFRMIFFLPVILSSGVLPGIESQNEFYNMMAGVAESVGDAAGVNISASLQNLLSVSGVGSGVFDVVFQMIDAIYDIVMASGIQIIVFLTGLQAISPSLYEAADVEGCTAWESFWKITFPMVSPLLLVNCIYTIIDFFMKNDNSVVELINSTMYGVQLNFGVASAMSWIYFGVALLFIAISTFIITRVVKSYE